jgi:capsule polysaccharide export protein KpsE/RkpR
MLLARCVVKKGLYPHHIEQWKLDFVESPVQDNSFQNKAEVKTLKTENKSLKKELNRKDKALAETAALLVLQKKCAKSGEPTRTTRNE